MTAGSREPFPHLAIVRACEAYLDQHGDNYLGVGWTKSQSDADTRYRVMLDLVRRRDAPASLLDFGCGLSHLYEYMARTGYQGLRYSGLDLSERFLQRSRSKFPDVDYHNLDLLNDDAALPAFDYIVMNGIFNLKASASFENMLAYWKALVSAVYAKTRIGMAFNVMSTQVDWERDDLFHLPFDLAADFLTREVSRHFVIRHDYGLYEYTVYVYRQA
jgi:SAM-dependent methyltransferase